MRKEMNLVTILLFTMLLTMGSTCSKQNEENRDGDETETENVANTNSTDSLDDDEIENTLPTEMTGSGDEDKPVEDASTEKDESE